MTEREALLRAVCDDPDDDTPRLVFADWLDEHGEDERAEFIRLQCRASLLEASSLGPGDADEWAAAQARADLILERHRETWTDELGRATGLSREFGTWGGYERGFATYLSIWRGARVRPDWDRVFSTTPLHDLSLGGVENVGEALRHPTTRHLRSLGLLGCDLAESDLLSLTSRERYPRLTSLRLHLLEGPSPEVGERLGERFGTDLELEFDHVPEPDG